MPANDGHIILPGAARNSLVVGKCAFPPGNGGQLVLGLLLGLDREVDVPDFVVELRYKLNAGNLRDNREGVGVRPRIIGKLSVSTLLG